MKLIEENKYLRDKVEDGTTTFKVQNSTEPTKRDYIESESECDRPIFSGINSKITLMVPEATERLQKGKSKFHFDDLVLDKHTRSHYF